MNEPADRGSCGMCGADALQRDLVRGARIEVCRGCVELALTSTLRSSTDEQRLASTLTGGYRDCWLCGSKSAPSSLYVSARDDGASACVTCLHQAYETLTQGLAVRVYRQVRLRSAESPHVAPLLDEHFDGVDPASVVTATRVFSPFARVDMQAALDRILEGTRCVGIYQRHPHEMVTYAQLVERGRDAIRVAPLQYEDVDVGAERPMRCLRAALWLAKSELPFAVVLSHTYTPSSAWRIEVCVPAGPSGNELAHRFFDDIETSIARSPTYRGKVLSLEGPSRHSGILGGGVTVHRLASVGRHEIILPERTLELLEKNVFNFVTHRKRLAELELPVKKGLLFYGPPGTGKTHTIRYLAGALEGHTTFLITAEEVALLDEYLALARLLTPSIVVIEDVDLIARDREDMRDPREEVLLNRLLNEMDGLKETTEVLFILTTNRPESLERALASRPGRIDQAIEFPMPDEAARAKLVELYRRGLEVPPDVAVEIVRRTDRTSAAFIKELMRRIGQYVLERADDTPIATRTDVDVALDEMLFRGGTLNAKLLGVRSDLGFD